MDENISSPLGLLAGGKGARGTGFLDDMAENEDDDDEEEEDWGDLERDVRSPDVDGTRASPGVGIVDVEVERAADERNRFKGFRDHLRGGLFVFRYMLKYLNALFACGTNL